MSRRLLRQAEDWVDELKESLGNIRSRGRERLSQLSEDVPLRPLLGVAAAVGLGLLVAGLLKRRNRWDAGG